MANIIWEAFQKYKKIKMLTFLIGEKGVGNFLHIGTIPHNFY